MCSYVVMPVVVVRRHEQFILIIQCSLVCSICLVCQRITSVQVDMDTGSVDQYDHGRHCFMSQPVFVGRPGATAEDDGWLLSLTHDAGRW